MITEMERSRKSALLGPQPPTLQQKAWALCAPVGIQRHQDTWGARLCSHLAPKSSVGRSVSAP